MTQRSNKTAAPVKESGLFRHLDEVPDVNVPSRRVI
jgi:hypothetical protein